MSDGALPEMTPAPAPPQQQQQVQIGEALINPTWQGHLVALGDNGGDCVMLTIIHPRLGPIPCLWPRSVAAGLMSWLGAALAAPVLIPQPQGQQQSPEAPKTIQ